MGTVGDRNDKQGGRQDMGGKIRRSKALLPVPMVQTAQVLVLLYGRLKGELSKAIAGEDVLIPVSDARFPTCKPRPQFHRRFWLPALTQ